MRVYYATKLSPNISRMPNGFLVCKNVSIARTGTQEYQGSELGIAETPDEMFKVYRDESEVFTPAAIASFEGVPLVDEHPTVDVTVENAGNLMRGFVKDVRRGTGDDSDKVLADIIVTDPITIAEIESGKREISCGYKCDFEFDVDGRMVQRNIRGNHVALVGKGRAGEDVAIKDAETHAHITTAETVTQKRRAKFMGKSTKSNERDNKGMLSKFFGVLTADADPDVIAEITEQLVEAVEDPIDESAAEHKDEATASAESGKDEDVIPGWAAKILERLDRIEAMYAPKTPDEDPLSELEKEIGGGEEAVTKPVEEMDEGESLGDEASLDAGDMEAGESEQSKDEEPDKGESVSDARDAISKAKKQVSKIKDATTRRAVSDAMAGLIRQAYGIKPSTPKGSYTAIMAAKHANAKQMNDAYPTFDNMEARQAVYDKRNPHKKG